jgi:hypothetical protein
VFRCGSPGGSRPWRGFPIRTPWDHSPVIDSPRLIADSYVLLRLLMPRHPPCALKNLTTKDQKNAFRENHGNQPRTRRHPVRSRFIFLEIASYKRCSRPLCSSQTTTPYHTPHTHGPRKGPDPCMIGAARKPETNKTRDKAPALLPQDPTVCQTLNRPHPPAPFQDTLKRVSVLGQGKTGRPLFADIPPVSTRRRTIACAAGIYSWHSHGTAYAGRGTAGAP